MNKENKLRVHIEFGEAKADFEGDANQVFEAIVRFLSQVYPSLEIIQRIVFEPDLARLSQSLIGLVEITSEGPIVVSKLDLPARDAVCLALLAMYVGSKLGQMSKETLSSDELAKITGKARKTISNEMPGLVSDGLVEKTAEGEYRLTAIGIRRTEETIKEHLAKTKGP